MSGSRSSEKWIHGLDASMPADEAARRVIELRLSAVAGALKQARKREQLEAPLVHQLRVATRRAEAAMQAFASLTDGSLAKQLSKKLKSIRRAAGEVRMCDVHLAELRRLHAHHGDAQQRAAFEHAIVRTSFDRQQTGRQLERVARRWRGKSWRRAIGDFVEAIPSARDNSASSLKAFADEGLAGLAGQFIAAAHDDLAPAEKLHELRIDGKRVRYALEIFAECMDEQFVDDLYAQLAGLQERLGAINDSHEIAERLLRYSAEMSAALQSAADEPETPCEPSTLCAQLDWLAQELRQQSQTAHQEFLAWWQGGQRHRFTGALQRLGSNPVCAAETEGAAMLKERADVELSVERDSVQAFVANPQEQHS